MSTIALHQLSLDELTELEEKMLSILDRSNFPEKRRRALRVYNELLPDHNDREYFRPLLNELMAIVNDDEELHHEQVQINLDLMKQRDDSFVKLEDAELEIERLRLRISELNSVLHDYFQVDVVVTLEEDRG